MLVFMIVVMIVVMIVFMLFVMVLLVLVLLLFVVLLLFLLEVVLLLLLVVLVVLVLVRGILRLGSGLVDKRLVVYGRVTYSSLSGVERRRGTSSRTSSLDSGIQSSSVVSSGSLGTCCGDNSAVFSSSSGSHLFSDILC